MKLLIFASIVFATGFQPAEAMELGRIKNDGGGSIVFTTEVCKHDQEQFFVYGYVASGAVGKGCYAVFNGDLVVTWQDGDVRIYPLSNVQVSNEFRKALAERGVAM